jgi:integrase/recombinase XerC
MFEKFIDYLRFEKRFSEHTVVAYENDLKQFAEFIAITTESEMYDVKSTTVRSWIVDLMEKGLKSKSRCLKVRDPAYATTNLKMLTK